MKGWYNMKMNKKLTSHPFYVVYNPELIVEIVDDITFYILVGLRVSPYPLASDEIKFIGSYLESHLIVSALSHYCPN